MRCAVRGTWCVINRIWSARCGVLGCFREPQAASCKLRAFCRPPRGCRRWVGRGSASNARRPQPPQPPPSPPPGEGFFYRAADSSSVTAAPRKKGLFRWVGLRPAKAFSQASGCKPQATGYRPFSSPSGEVAAGRRGLFVGGRIGRESATNARRIQRLVHLKPIPRASPRSGRDPGPMPDRAPSFACRRPARPQASAASCPPRTAVIRHAGSHGPRGP